MNIIYMISQSKRLTGYRNNNIFQCFTCGKGITKNNEEGVCYQCASDKTKIITDANAKNIFHLDDQDLNLPHLNFFYVRRGQNVKKKFFISEIKELYMKKYSNEEKFKKSHAKTAKFIRTTEIDSFMLKNITNYENEKILELKKKYVVSNSIDILEIQENMKKIDLEIKNEILQKFQCLENLSECVTAELDNLKSQKSQFVNDLAFQIKSILFVFDIEDFIEECVDNFVETHLSGDKNFTKCLLDKQLILKANIADAVIDDIISLLYSELDGIQTGNWRHSIILNQKK